MGKTRVEFLEVLLPRLEPIRQNVKILRNVHSPREARVHVAHSILVDLCTCFETFAAVDDDVIGPKTKVVTRKVADVSWLMSAGKELNSALLQHGLEWPDYDAEPPGIARDLVSMYKEADTARAAHKVLSSKDLHDSLRKVGAESCRLAREWDERDTSADLELLHEVAIVGKNCSQVLTVLGVLAVVAEALTLPGSILQFGPDIVELGREFGYLIQTFANYAASEGHDLGGMLAQIANTYNDKRLERQLEELWILDQINQEGLEPEGTDTFDIDPSNPSEIKRSDGPELPGFGPSSPG